MTDALCKPSALDHIVGVIHIKDLLRHLIKRRAVGMGDVRPIPRVPKTSKLNTVIAAMGRERSQMVVVINEYGGTAGLVTIEDLFEEVIGEIEDGALPNRPQLYRDPSGQLHAAGAVRLEEIGENLGRALGNDEVDTVSGLILMHLERPAVAGDEARYDGVRFEVTAVEGSGVKECRVMRSQSPDDE